MDYLGLFKKCEKAMENYGIGLMGRIFFSNFAN